MEMKRKKYNISVDDIISGKYNSDQIIDPVWWSVSIYGLEKYEDDLSRFTQAQRLILALFWYDGEVCNGGHDQFLSNSTGIVWKDALAGFRLIGADECAEILENVVAKCGGDIPLDRQKRNDLLEKITKDPENEDKYIDLFGEDDRKYYKICDSSYELIDEYIKAHPEEFVFSGEVDVPVNVN